MLYKDYELLVMMEDPTSNCRSQYHMGFVAKCGT